MTPAAIAAADWPRWRARLGRHRLAAECADHGDCASPYFADTDGPPY